MNLEVIEKTVSQVVEQRITLYGVTWEQYEIVRTNLDDCAGLRMTYLEGTLEFFMPSQEHELIKKVIARLIELYSLETNTRIYGYGSTTYRKQAKERALEPDECYCVGSVKEFPDFAIEVNLTSGGIDKLEVYRGLGVPEVWIWEKSRLSFYYLHGDNYERIEGSRFLPNLDIDLLVRCANIPDQHDAVVEFRNALR
ncbi:Uma2 family endonuclease [Kamptonema sp. UHCC 0994]|uniref:Uma2 family endonuclease n=1 Tax=Kamptonema sp. UHCC 0994 TaxID=3031329 RepID=UPI0023B8FC95|nr:Uma2 family endonuclease [Kamptonema sp. UHCC 0994]MDF0552918.1 Uma2 family endonuclease [Kamptonema sp. UHCC 0994]